MRPRWKRVLGQTNGALGEAIGKLYVDETFPPEAKQKAQEMVDNIIAAFGDRIKNLDWMTEPTKQKALEKLEKMIKFFSKNKFDFNHLNMKNNSMFELFIKKFSSLNGLRFLFKIPWCVCM
jgi:putative endopeptidase